MDVMRDAGTEAGWFDGGASDGPAGEAREKAQLFGLRLASGNSAPMNAAYDELPGVSASRLRAFGDITEAMNVAIVKLGEYEFTVGLSLFRWPNGGSWSFFVCPCGRRQDNSAVRGRSRVLPVS